jgi:hypothetical protein
MEFYTFVLDDELSDMCIVATPFGKYQQNHVQMGLKPATGWVQATL